MHVAEEVRKDIYFRSPVGRQGKWDSNRLVPRGRLNLPTEASDRPTDRSQLLRCSRGLSSHSCASLQVLLDLGRVLPVEPLCFLVELGVPLIDVVDVGIIIVWASSTVFVSLFNLLFQV